MSDVFTDLENVLAKSREVAAEIGRCWKDIGRQEKVEVGLRRKLKTLQSELKVLRKQIIEELTPVFLEEYEIAFRDLELDKLADIRKTFQDVTGKDLAKVYADRFFAKKDLEYK